MSERRPIDPVAAAICWAIDAHAGQEYPGLGKRPPQPYIRHVLRVVMAVEGESAQVVAALHDVLEDTERGLPPWISYTEACAVELLTWRDDPHRYVDYIDRLARFVGEAGTIARAVKVADLMTNIEHDPDRILRKRDTYEAALARLRPRTPTAQPSRESGEGQS